MYSVTIADIVMAFMVSYFRSYVWCRGCDYVQLFLSNRMQTAVQARLCQAAQGSVQSLCLLLQCDPQNHPESLWGQTGGVLLGRVHVFLHRSLLRGQSRIQKYL